MRRSLGEIEAHAYAALDRRGLAGIAAGAASRCAWLEGAGYPGLKLLAEALAGERRGVPLDRDAIGIDLKEASCVFLATELDAFVKAHGRVFLRNVKHGLYLLPASIQGNYAIGCPVDPAFALGGERSKNPYVEKLAASARDGVEVDEAVWQSLSR